MPNWVTNKVSAPKEVLQSLINTEGRIDFNTLISFGGAFPWAGIDCAAEMCAEVIAGQPLDDNPLIASLQQSNRQGANVMKLSDEQFEQFVQMLRNKRLTGHFHTLDFANANWGTKWNACDQQIDLEGGKLSFDTAWSCPEPVLKALSAKHPEADIHVLYADEDIGSNCGILNFKGGAAVARDESAGWNKMSEADQQKWHAFACEVKGYEPEPDED
ncbi:hypothetical protein ACIPL1_30690 [Pseudomonas sp. NPDC090202]|uniref:DUF1281 family ferredoxin-like fold protein n=1 Tax=Pseudomonas sp. NPDC090202 TaxID=3364476 RepID=UPI0038295424